MVDETVQVAVAQAPKVWYKSLTVWAAVATVANIVALYFQAYNTPLALLVAGVAGAVAVYGRSRAQGPLQ